MIINYMKTKPLSETSEFSFVLAPSKIHGIGVFATHNIKKGTKLRLFSEEDPRYISIDSPLLNSPLKKKFCETYCVKDADGYYCPLDFGKKEIGWHLNHSKVANAYHIEYIYYALKDIDEGEEITIDYGTLNETE